MLFMLELSWRGWDGAVVGLTSNTMTNETTQVPKEEEKAIHDN